MTAPMGYNEIDAVEGFGGFETSEEAIRPFGPAGRVFVRGGLSTATLNTPKGPATLNLPSPVPTLPQFRALEQAVNTNNQRVTAELARLSREAATRGQQGIGMLPLLLIGFMAKDRFDHHSHPGDGQEPSAAAGGSNSLSALLPLLLLQPGLLGGLGLGGSRSSAPGSQDSISPLLMAFVLMNVLQRR